MSISAPIEGSACRVCDRPLGAGSGCLHCAMAGALSALDEACSDPEKAKALSPETRAGLPLTRTGFSTFAPPELPGRFAHFEVKREVATGGMGTVYEAEDTRLGRTVALKMIRAFAFSTAEEKARFTAEAGAAAALDHPNIVPIYEIGDVGGQPFFTMKLIEGATLAGRLRDGAMPAREAAALMAKIARAVQHAHSRGVLHRDLKPGNILLAAQGEPFLTDFGLAKLADHDSGLTVSHAQLGTPQYMSPEQAAGRTRDISTASDVWALGVMLCQILSGRLPFEGESRGEILRKIVEEETSFEGGRGRKGLKEPKGPRAVPSVPLATDLATLIARCLEKEPARRMASAGLLADELERWLSGRPIRSRPVTAGERVWKWMRRHPYRVAAVTALAVSLLGGSVTSLVLWRRAERARAAAVHTADHERRTAYAASLAAAAAARERADFGAARRFLEGVAPELRGFDWRLMRGRCAGDEEQSFDFGKEAAPECLAWSPDGARLAVITADARMHTRDLQGAEIAPPRALPVRPATLDLASARGTHHAFAFSPDGRRFLVAWGNLLRVLDVESFALLHEEVLTMPDAAWLDGERVLLGGNAGVTELRGAQGAWILDLRDNTRAPLPAGLSAPLAVSPDRRFAAFTASGSRAVEVLAVETMPTAPPECRISLSEKGDRSPNLLRFSADGTVLLAVSGEALRPALNLGAFERASGQRIFSQDFKFPIIDLAVDPHSTRVAVVGEDATLRIYEYRKAGAAALRGHEDRTSGVAFTPDGQTLFSASADGTLRRWPATERTQGQRALRLGPLHSFYFGLHSAASADGRRILFNAADRSARFYDAATRQTTPLPPAHCPLAALADGRFLTQHGNTGEVLCWAIAEGQPRELWRTAGLPIKHYTWTRSGVLSRDERTVVGSIAGLLFVVDLESRTLLASPPYEFQSGSRGVVGHAVSPDVKWIAATGFGRHATIHAVTEPGKILTNLAGLDDGRGYDTAVAFHPREPLVYVGNEDGRIRVWEYSTDGRAWRPRPEFGWHAHRGAVTALAASHDGALVATSGDDSLKLLPALPEPGVPGRRERVVFPLEHAANWLHFARDTSGRDTALLHSSPWGMLEVWQAGFQRDE